MKIRPLAGYVFVEPKEVEMKTSSGIILPESATAEKPQEGKVVGVGDAAVMDGKTIEPPVKVGDMVIYKKWGTNEVKIEDKEFYLIKFEDLMAVIEEESKKKIK